MRPKITLDRFMKEKTLAVEHQNIFSKIDNILEQDVVQFELNPTKDNSIFGAIGKELAADAVKLKDMGPPVMQVFTRPEARRVNPLEEDL